MSIQFYLVAPMFAALFVSALILLPLSLYILGPYCIKIVLIDKGYLICKYCNSSKRWSLCQYVFNFSNVYSINYGSH